MASEVREQMHLFKLYKAREENAMNKSDFACQAWAQLKQTLTFICECIYDRLNSGTKEEKLQQ